MTKIITTKKQFDGFNAYYDREIYTYLSDLENEREAKHKKSKKLGRRVGIFGAVLAVLMFIFTKIIFFSLFILGASLIYTFAMASKTMAGLKSEIKNYLLEKITKYLGWEYNETDFEPPKLGKLRENHLLSTWDRSSFEDEIKGKIGTASFKLCEAKLEREDIDSDGEIRWVDVFSGIIMEVSPRKKFMGRTVVLRDWGIFNRKQRAGMKRVGLESIKFEKIFEAYSTDQVEARYLLTPDFMQKLIDLENSVDGHNMRLGFLDSKLYIAIEMDNQFEIGSMRAPLTEPELVQKIIDECEAIISIVEAVTKTKKNHKAKS